MTSQCIETTTSPFQSEQRKTTHTKIKDPYLLPQTLTKGSVIYCPSQYCTPCANTARGIEHKTATDQVVTQLLSFSFTVYL